MSAALSVFRTDLGVRIVTVTLPDLRPVLGVTFRLLRTDLSGGIVSAALSVFRTVLGGGIVAVALPVLRTAPGVRIVIVPIPDLGLASGGGIVTVTPRTSLTSAVGL
ncbi:hypothetical protein ACIBF7_01005 [Nonomuraea sp. NPDC050478]|uniref:hypothetical protein n=1 Tax=Nonomuraea sp. NPDC050478 TaxID=3364365 RepID=UPI0037A3199C